jgi:DNA-3-methyladenine glycosylase II
MRAHAPEARWRAARRHLRDADPVLAGLLERVGPCTLAPRRGRSHFGTLLRSIVFQQLSGAAAETIHRRFLALLPGGPTPGAVLALSDEALRAAGLSRGKVRSVRALSRECEEGRLALPVPWRWSDERVVGALTRVHGIGPWTAQMFLMFHLARPDVLPTADLGLRKAVARAYGRRAASTAERIERLGERWRPWRTVATWTLWRSLDVPVSAAARRRGSARSPGATRGRSAARRRARSP